MITLPAPPRAAHLRSFWFALSSIFGMRAAICLHVLAVPHSVMISAATFLLLLGAGIFGTDWIRPLYTCGTGGLAW